MVKYRYQLLQQTQLHHQQPHHTKDYRSKTFHTIVYGLLLCLLVLYYGYHGFFSLSTWYAQNDQRTMEAPINTVTNLWRMRLTNAPTVPETKTSESTTTTTISTTTTTTTTTIADISSTERGDIASYSISMNSPTSESSTTTTTTITEIMTTADEDATIYTNYYVHSKQCHMPRVDPFTVEMRKRFKPMKPANCSSDVSLVTTTYNHTTRRYTLHLNQSELALKRKQNTQVSCCYQEIIRFGGNGASADKGAKLLSCIDLITDMVVPTHIEAMLVTCSRKSQKTKAKVKIKKLLQKDAFSFVQYKNATNTNTTNTNTTTTAANMPNLLLIGIDSLSRFNFRRNMPKTFAFLDERHWFELEGYNKVADNTFPNLMALLTGFNQSTAYAQCKPTAVGGLDDCPIIWKHFKALGYRTAYAEDIGSMSTFNYLKKGFRNPPTDHYARPFILSIESNLKVTHKARLPFCVGRRQYGEYVYDYAQQFAETYRNEPTFGLFWTNSFSHNSYDVPSSMDVRMRRYFEDFEKSGVLNTSIVFFFSDHGMRFGSVLEMPEGFLEERLPMFFIWLPEAFKRAHPQLARALLANRNRLTTPYDIHMTLVHLLQLTQHPRLAHLNLTDYHADGCRNCQSVFTVVPPDRSCSNVSIPDHWCTCVPYARLHPKDKLVQKIATNIVGSINAYLSKASGAEKCRVLKLKKVVDAQKRMKEENNNSSSTVTIYRIKLVTSPESASFESTITYDSKTHTTNLPDIEDISRLDSYAHTSRCLKTSELRKYCIC